MKWKATEIESSNGVEFYREGCGGRGWILFVFQLNRQFSWQGAYLSQRDTHPYLSSYLPTFGGVARAYVQD